MTEIIENPETLLLGSKFTLANGNIIQFMPQSKKSNSDSIHSMLVSPPLAHSRLSEMEEERMREKQFCDMIMHVIDKIEKEGEEDSVKNEELMSETSLWDLKSFLKAHINVSGVSEDSPIVVLESVNTKLTNVFHDSNLFDIGRLAACTKVEIDFIASRTKNVLASDVLVAVEDAKSVMKILRAVHYDEKEERKEAKIHPWMHLSQVTNLLHIKSPSKKFAGMMGQLSPKNIGTSIVDIFVGQSAREDEDIDSFHAM